MKVEFEYFCFRVLQDVIFVLLNKMRRHRLKYSIIESYIMLSLTILTLLGYSSIIQGSPVVGPRVVNGTNATIGEFPFMISLKDHNFHVCGGTIIASQWVLTAGHCVDDERPSDLKVFYGNNSLNNGNAAKNQGSVQVVGMIRHPNYTNGEYKGGLYLRNDLTLLKLEHPLNFSDLVQPIKLPKQDEAVPINHTATLTGWGYTDAEYDEPKYLQKVNLTIFDYPYCDNYNSANNFDNTQNLCAGNLGNTKGQCNGDSGGPLFVDGVQWGIVSWSIKPCISAPGVFTRTSVFVDWIKNVTGI